MKLKYSSIESRKTCFMCYNYALAKTYSKKINDSTSHCFASQTAALSTYNSLSIMAIEIMLQEAVVELATIIDATNAEDQYDKIT